MRWPHALVTDCAATDWLCEPCRFITFLKAPNAVATLLDPSHSVGILLGGARLLALLACRESLALLRV